MTYANGNLGPDLGQAQQCGGVKLVNGIQTLPLKYVIFFSNNFWNINYYTYLFTVRHFF